MTSHLNHKAVRFLALYRRGKNEHLTHLILGHGYMEHGGLSHSDLVSEYGVTNDRADMYAGYLTMKNDCIKVLKGGSQTLFIDEDGRRNADVEKVIESTKMGDIISKLFPHITRDLVSHVMLANQ